MRRILIVLLSVACSGTCDYRQAPIGFDYNCVDEDSDCPSCKLEPSYGSYSAEYRNQHFGFSLKIPSGVIAFATREHDSGPLWQYSGIAIDPVSPTGVPIDPDGNDKPYLSVEAQCHVSRTIDEYIQDGFNWEKLQKVRKSDFHSGGLNGRRLTSERRSRTGRQKVVLIDYFVGQNDIATDDNAKRIYYDIALRTTELRKHQDEILLKKVLAGFSLQAPSEKGCL